MLISDEAVVKNNTSYTHQWKQGDPILKQVSMASVDSIEEQKQAIAEGWRTFRVTSDLSDKLPNEMANPLVTPALMREFKTLPSLDNFTSS